MISPAADDCKRMLGSTSNGALSEHQKFDDFNHGDWLASDRSRCFNRNLPLFELGIRDEHEGGIGTGLCPLCELAKVGCCLLLDPPVLNERKPVCLEDADSFPDRW